MIIYSFSDFRIDSKNNKIALKIYRKSTNTDL